MELDKLLVKIETDLSDLKRGLDKANNEVKKSSGRMSNEFKKLGTTLTNIGNKVVTFGGLLAGAFGAYQVKQVVDVGRQIEDLQVRLKALFGTAEEGARAFDVMVKFAGKVPFSLEEIQSASGNLAVVAKDSQELAKVLKITGNVASVTGLSFQQTAEQIQRSLSGGIASADVFREKGVRNLLGFSAGAEVSASQTAKAFEEVFGEGGRFGNATDELAKTFTGTLSMLQDKLFSFRSAISEEFMAELKKQFKDLDTSLADSQEAINKFGKEIGESLAKAVKLFAENIEEIITALKLFAGFLAGTAGLAIIAFLKKVNLLVAGITTLVLFGGDLIDFFKKLGIELAKHPSKFDDITTGIDKTTKKTIDYNKIQRELKSALEESKLQAQLQSGVIGAYPQILEKAKKETEKFIISQEDLKEITERITKEIQKSGEAISEAFGKAVVAGKGFKESMKQVFESLLAKIAETIFHILVMEPLIKSLTDTLKGLNDQRERSQKNNEKERDGAIINAIVGAFTGGAGGGSSSGFLGFANGGYTPPNKPYMVGERGAELFVPRTAGNIVPNNELGGSGVVVNQSISFSTGVVPTVRAEVLNLLPTIKQETINAVAEQRSRGGAFARTFGA